MATTETTRDTTVRQALKTIRADLSGRDYLSGGGPIEYRCDRGTLLVRNAPADGGSVLLGVFEAELVGSDGQTIRTYKV